jgi:hypothetical protein
MSASLSQQPSFPTSRQGEVVTLAHRHVPLMVTGGAPTYDTRVASTVPWSRPAKTSDPEGELPQPPVCCPVSSTASSIGAPVVCDRGGGGRDSSDVQREGVARHRPDAVVRRPCPDGQLG